MIQLLVKEELTNKNFDGNESFVETNCDQHRAANYIPPPLTLPPPPPEEYIDVDDMGHDATQIPLYEDDEDPIRHRFICEPTQDANVVTSEDRQMTQFAGALRKWALTWYMTYTDKTPNATKAEIK